jgi:hypothetical protein
MTARERLPDRRPHELRDVEFAGIKYVAGLNPAGRVGTDLEAHARDAAITTSLALQFGVPLDTISISV